MNGRGMTRRLVAAGLLVTVFVAGNALFAYFVPDYGARMAFAVIFGVVCGLTLGDLIDAVVR